MVNVIMHGCNGKMGRVITNLVSQDNDIEIVAGVDAYTGIDNEYPVFTSIKECTVKADRGTSVTRRSYVKWVGR